jgi:hypothetical protein
MPFIMVRAIEQRRRVQLKGTAYQGRIIDPNDNLESTTRTDPEGPPEEINLRTRWRAAIDAQLGLDDQL